MTSRRLRTVAKVALALTTIGFVSGLAVTAASAHPLGNFSVNHLNQLSFSPGGVTDHAVVDTAEIPTAQAESLVDADGNGDASPSELIAYGEQQCAAFEADLILSIDGDAVALVVTSSTFAYNPGQAGLTTSRLECTLEGAAAITSNTTVEFTDGFLPDRVGWHEINAVADGVRLIDSPVPQKSVTEGLTKYPVDLLASPLDVRSATFDVQLGAGPSTVAADARDGLDSANVGFFSGIVDNVQRTFDDLIGRRELTLGIGMLAVSLALVLGASHALLPGHGKTVMAAYIAGRQGSVRDAVIVGATVTGTHTGGVLLLGLALTLSTSLAGETVLGWLGVTSGVLVAGLGIGLLISAIRHHGAGPFGHGHTHSYDLGDGHSHTHGGRAHSHGGQSHSHGPLRAERAKTVESVMPDRAALVRSISVGPGPGPGSGSGSGSGSVGVIDFTALLTAPAPPAWEEVGHHDHDRDRDRDHDHDHDHDHDRDHDRDHDHDEAPKHVSRRGLIGMGIAGGLVPSPSALIILLSAIALGRTWFGILLVVGYGVGMAGTLTLAGVLLVKVRDRYQGRMKSSSGRVRSFARKWGTVAPYCTAGLVVIVGAGLALRSLGSI
ncbi:MAG: nickel transporter [Ilumatobacteraceae bacterium]